MASNMFRTVTTFQSTQTRSTPRRYDDEVCCCCIPILTGFRIIAVFVIVTSVFGLSQSVYVLFQKPRESSRFSMDRALFVKYGNVDVYVSVVSNGLKILLASVLLYGLHIRDHRFFIAPCIYAGIDIVVRVVLIVGWSVHADSLLHGGSYLNVPTDRRTQFVIVLCSWILNEVVHCAVQVYLLWTLSLASRVIKRQG